MKNKLLSTTVRRRHICVWLACLALLCGVCEPAYATSRQEVIQAQQEMPVESNEIPGWPVGPTVTAESAILMEAETGAILYAKNIHARQYPASTTKILTTLIAMEQCSLDEWVTFSKDAIYDTPSDSNHIAMDVGQQLTMEDCLNAILIRSANEVSFAVAEHITGTSWQDFAEIMNRRAQELGCVDSHFVNPNGLPDENHYTSAYDLAMIGRAFFANEVLCRMSMTPRLHILPNDHMPYEKLENSKIEMLPGKTYAYDGLIGVKTGYTNAARSTLVSCAERDGLKLICVVLKDEAPAQYEDTIALFNYGFGNFARVNVSQVETKYNIEGTGFFYEQHDIFGDSRPLLSLNQDAYIVMPRTVDFDDIASVINYDAADEGQAAVIEYSYQGVALGNVSVDLAAPKEGYSFESGMLDGEEKEAANKESPTVIFVNVIKVLKWVGIVVAALLFLGVALHFLKNFRFPARRTNTRRSWEKDRRRYHHEEYEDSSEDDARQQHRRRVREARRRQAHLESEEDFESTYEQQHRQRVKEARRRQARMEYEEDTEPTFEQLRRRSAREARRRQARMEYEESPELTFEQLRRQQARESRHRRQKDR
ncbi:MAG: D-alanyl-D-alanine carboxypeptidase [bacterium]|nr:D-alanyl-D-alanine carboxypeptidase [bacterium]MCM1374542.1 D-alanyl-D-alanine carboxypeptidase [Muribaculum sp.]